MTVGSRGFAADAEVIHPEASALLLQRPVAETATTKSDGGMRLGRWWVSGTIFREYTYDYICMHTNMMFMLEILLHVYIRVFIHATTLKYTQIFFFWSANQTRTRLTRCPRLHAATHTRQVIKTLIRIQLHYGRYRHVKIWVYCHLSEACKRGLLQPGWSAPLRRS